jgi:hypothetical protein
MDPAGRLGFFVNPNLLAVVGSTETVRQWFGVFEAEMGGAKSRPESA